MDFKFTPEEQNLVKEVRSFLKKEMTPEVVDETIKLGWIYGGTEGRKLIKKIGAKGWLCPTWPKEYGGLDSSEMVRFLILNELAYLDLPYLFVAASMAGPTILRIGSEEIKNRFLPPIARGEIEFALGYTEPHAGSDVASLEIRAEDKGDYFLINGQKTFNTACHVADYHWLAARTDPTVSKHKGISFIIVDLKSPGITIRPLLTMAGYQTNEVFYDNVKVPKKNLVGDLNRGFYYLMTALNFERMYPIAGTQRLFDALLKYVKETKVNGKPLGKNPLVRRTMSQLAIELEAVKHTYFQLAYLLDKGGVPAYESSMQKVFGSELFQRLSFAGLQIMGFAGQLKHDSRLAPLQGMMEHEYRASIVETIYGGTSEIQRNIIASQGLHLPAH